MNKEGLPDRMQKIYRKMSKTLAWVWFKGGEKGGFWKGGFTASDKNENGVLIEHSKFITCRVPEWRISLSEPTNISIGPNIPNDATWKLA